MRAPPYFRKPLLYKVWRWLPLKYILCFVTTHFTAVVKFIMHGYCLIGGCLGIKCVNKYSEIYMALSWLNERCGRCYSSDGSTTEGVSKNNSLNRLWVFYISKHFAHYDKQSFFFFVFWFCDNFINKLLIISQLLT